MLGPHWNKIEFAYWSRGDASVSVNPFSEGPIILELKGDGFETYDMRVSMTPAESRKLAAKLIEAAEAADKAGRHAAGQ